MAGNRVSGVVVFCLAGEWMWDGLLGGRYWGRCCCRWCAMSLGCSLNQSFYVIRRFGWRRNLGIFVLRADWLGLRLKCIGVVQAG